MPWLLPLASDLPWAPSCPPTLKLEAHLLGIVRSNLAPHVEECDRCREWLTQIFCEEEVFWRFVYPVTIAAVLRAAEHIPAADLARRRRFLV